MTNVPNDGRGTTRDPEQADKTGLPKSPETPDVELEIEEPGKGEATGPGTIHDPNMADRT